MSWIDDLKSNLLINKKIRPFSRSFLFLFLSLFKLK